MSDTTFGQSIDRTAVMDYEVSKTFAEMDFNVYFGLMDIHGNMPQNGTEGYIDYRILLKTMKNGE